VRVPDGFFVFALSEPLRNFLHPAFQSIKHLLNMAAQGGPAPPTSGQCNLDNAVINLTALRDHEKKELTDIISSVKNN
jgi:hypothetical protein